MELLTLNCTFEGLRSWKETLDYIMAHLQGCSQCVFFTEALAEFQHVICMIVRIWEVKRVACYARADTFTEAVVSVASMVATPLT